MRGEGNVYMAPSLADGVLGKSFKVSNTCVICLKL